MQKAMNTRLNEEIYSAYLYLAMAAQSTQLSLKGFAVWFDVQVKEELFHAQKTYEYILDRDAKVVLGAIEKPPASFKSVKEMFVKTLEHERFVTASINKVLTLARKENDHATEAVLQWFVTEQVEEESSVGDVLAQLKLIGSDGSGLYMLDREMGTRTFTPPPAGE